MAEKHELLIAGVGGWGIVTMGDILAKVALKQYPYVTWFPSYATAMRGGESECCVIFSDTKIPSPIIYQSGTILVLSAARLKAFEDRVRPGGLMVVETTGATEEQKVERADINVRYVSAMEAALGLGNVKNANMVMLGLYQGISNAVKSELLLEEIEARFGRDGREEVAAERRRAVEAGMELAKGLGQ
ncbi:MAG: 2-oxoacid:acceptor oxidoreductase family protein [Chloroflexota bacterium]|nr:2-oxoacid:acceptor oxidoreductase family protein [Chloroflexota bacterium]